MSEPYSVEPYIQANDKSPSRLLSRPISDDIGPESGVSDDDKRIYSPDWGARR